MKKSPFKELFGECDMGLCTSNSFPKAQKRKKVEDLPSNKKLEGKKKIFLILLFFLIALSLTFLITLLLKKPSTSQQDTSPIQKVQVEENNDPFSSTALDAFVKDFLSSSYKVNDSGAFAYVYEEVEDGVEVKKNGLISLGFGVSETEDYNYFLNGEIVSFDVDDEIRIVWDEFYRKYVLFKEENRYFIVTNESNSFYRNYLGQHILQDFLDDYLKNKEFVTQDSENVWLWEWQFYTPIDMGQKHFMQVQIELDLQSGYITEMRVLDEGKEICIYKFEFEKIDSFDVKEVLNDYVKKDEPELNI